MKKKLSQRQRLLNWHYQKVRSISMLDLLESDYQNFRTMVEQRLNLPYRSLDFREAIKKANDQELTYLEITRDEKRVGI